MNVKVSRGALGAVILTLVALELVSWVGVWLIETRSTGGELISMRNGVDHSELIREMEGLYYREARYHPNRWYALPANYRGKYVRTDAFGFRIDRSENDANGPVVGLFGGSAVFSTTTRQEGTIPSALSRILGGRAAVMNYGVGGYSTSAEIPTLIEAIRIDRGMRIAVFYDGANEVGRFLELVQDERNDAFLPIVGYPFDRTLRVALDNAPGGSWLPYKPKMLVLADYFRLVWRKIGSRASPITQAEPQAIDALAQKVVDLYVGNVEVLDVVARANGVIPIFLWHPDIFLTGKTLTQRESQILLSRPAALRELTRAVYRRVTADPRVKRLNFFDVTRDFDQLQGDQFFDYCHVSEDANEVMARRIREIIAQVVPHDALDRADRATDGRTSQR